MPTNNKRVTAFLVLLFIVLPISGVVYNRAFQLPKDTVKDADTSIITNKDVLYNTLPKSVVDAVEDRVAVYSSDAFSGSNIYHVAKKPIVSGETYQFTLVPADTTRNLDIKVTIQNSNSILNVQTSINGQIQDSNE